MRPDANVGCDCGNESTTVTQSLLILDSKQSFEVARQLAYECMSKREDINCAACRAFLLCFARDPSLVRVARTWSVRLICRLAVEDANAAT